MSIGGIETEADLQRFVERVMEGGTLASLVRQLQGNALVRALYGSVTAAGAIGAAGSGGWSISGHVGGSGIYVVTFAPAFTALPIFVKELGPTGGIQVGSMAAKALGSVTVQTFISNTGGASDVGFDFVAIGPR